MLCFESRAVTDIGNHRDVNQDGYVEVTDCINNKYVGLYCVADGMGGLYDGEYASRLAVTKTLQWYKSNAKLFRKRNLSINKIRKSLKTLFYSINTAIFNYGQQNGIRVGTTYSLLLISEDRYCVVHAGDSRIYLNRDNKLYLLTKDQTWVNDQLERGFISAEQAQNHPKKNVLANCLGCFKAPSICMGDGVIRENDCFLLCSDGFYNMLTTDEITYGMACDNLRYAIDGMVALVKQRGGYDNITVIMVNTLSDKGLV
jgi:serine/threonine protein phosphatase PrpC